MLMADGGVVGGEFYLRNTIGHDWGKGVSIDKEFSDTQNGNLLKAILM
jgi:hypothetical protein